MTKIFERGREMRKISEKTVEPVVKGDSSVKAVSRALKKEVQSATRSDRLAAEMLAKGLDATRAVEMCTAMSEATVERPIHVWDTERSKWVTRIEEVPDWKARGFVLKYMKEVHGWGYETPKQDITVNQMVLSQAKDVENLSADQVIAEREKAIRALRGVKAEQIQEIEGVADDNTNGRTEAG